MFSKGLAAAIVVAGSVGAADAAVLRITGTSASGGELGYFLVDEDVLALDSSLMASQFEGYSFSNPNSGVTYDPSTVDGDTGVTYFGYIGGEWTVTGGGGDSLTDTDTGTGVWIAGSSYLWFSGTSDDYSDVSWSTSVVSDVPLGAGAMFLLTGVGALGFARRRKT